MPDKNAPVTLIRTKFHRPAVTSDYLRRPHLSVFLDQHRHLPLTLVCAPAGFGKTTLMSAWLESNDWPHVWLSLDEHDSNLSSFLQYLLGAVQTRFPDALPKTQALLRTADLPATAVLARSLINEFDDLDEPFVLALDDYHVVHDPAIHELLTEVLRFPPRCLHVMLATRHDPPLSIASLRAGDKMAEIRSADLRFNSDEAGTFLRKVAGGDVDGATQAALQRRAEGWAAALRLSALALRNRPGAKRDLSYLPEQNDYATDYLVAEVLAHQSPAMHEFLLKTSILSRMNGALCEAVTGMRADAREATGQSYLARLLQMDLFVSPLDDDQLWYRYHHLFQELLQGQLQRSASPSAIADLHRRAATWYAGNGWIEEALDHFLAAGDVPAAVQFFAQSRHTLMDQEHWQSLDQRIHRFSRKVIDAHPELLLTEAWIAQNRVRDTEIPPIVDRAEALIAQMASNPDLARALQGEVAALRSFLYYGVERDNARSNAYAQMALTQVPHNWGHVYVIARLFCSAGFLLRGETHNAYATCYDGLAEDQGDAFKAHLMAAACFLHWHAADLPGLSQASGQVLALAGGTDIPQTVNFGRYFMGLAHYQRNELAEAEQFLSRVIAERYQAYVAVFVNSAFALACTYQAQGRPNEARKLAELVTAHLLEMRSPILLPVAMAFQAELALRQGRLADAVSAVDALPVPELLPMKSHFYAPYLTVAKVRLAQDTPASRKSAADLLGRLRERSESAHNTIMLIETLALQALLYDSEKQREAALAALERAVVMAQPSNFIRLFVDLGPRMGYLLNQLCHQGVAQEYVQRILDAFVEAKSPAPANGSGALIEPLSPRELEVLALLEKRLRDKEIAAILVISPGTVKRHTNNIFQKMLVSNRIEAVNKAQALGLLPVPVGSPQRLAADLARSLS